jgi:hypothetical protein
MLCGHRLLGGFSVGHHLLFHREQVLPIRDPDLQLLKHVLARGAANLGFDGLRTAIETWDWQGPGVWMNVEASVLVGRSDVFDAATTFVRSIGKEIPVDYLNRTVGDPELIKWLSPQSTAEVIDRIEEVRRFLDTTG